MGTYREDLYNDCPHCLDLKREISGLRKLLQESQARESKINQVFDQFADSSKCFGCGFTANIVKRFCQGGFFKLCPKYPHLHCECENCGNQWLGKIYDRA